MGGWVDRPPPPGGGVLKQWPALGPRPPPPPPSTALGIPPLDNVKRVYCRPSPPALNGGQNDQWRRADYFDVYTSSSAMAFVTDSNRPQTALATPSNRLPNRLWGRL